MSTSSQFTNADEFLLAKAIYAEARGEPYVGKVAVGAVILNRVKSSKFPNSISGVVYQPWAFTAVNDGQINLTPDAESKRAAKDAMSGWDPTYGCIYYYNPAKATSKWIFSTKKVMEIGKHVFSI
ncbi:MAG: cell wall hydrolase [Clostridia bacterium]